MTRKLSQYLLSMSTVDDVVRPHVPKEASSKPHEAFEAAVEVEMLGYGAEEIDVQIAMYNG